MPEFSIIIPSYNHAQYIRDAIESVLSQTCQDFELIVVDDASTDNTRQVVKEFNDSRIRYLVHPNNKGLSATRNSGIKAATGNFLAFLDADDWYHPQKLEFHLDFLYKNPDIDVAYNARYELNHSSKTIRDIWRPPTKVGLSDFILGFPFAPSDIVIRRESAFKAGLLDENYVFYGEDLYFNCKMAMGGCHFASVDRVLNYRRYHSGKKFKNIAGILNVMLDVLNRVFNDPRCSEEVKTLKDIAYARYYLWYGIVALTERETALGQSYLKEAVRLNPLLLSGRPPLMAEEVIKFCILDDSSDHEDLLKCIISQLPEDLKIIFETGEEWLIAHGFLLKGIRAAIWERFTEAKLYFEQAATHRGKMNKPLLTQISFDLINYEKEFGGDAIDKVIQNLTPFIIKIENPTDIKWSKGLYFVNRAFTCFNEREYSKVPWWVARAVIKDPSSLKNRGVVKIFFLSLLRYQSYKPN